MQLFMGVFRGEIAKLAARKKYIVFLVIEVLICAIVLLVQMAVEHASGIGLRGLNLRMMLLGFFISIYIPLIIFMGACDLFSSEVSENSMRASLMRPASRFKVFFAKTLAVYLLGVCYLFALFFVTVILEIVGGSSLHGFFSSFGAYLLDAIPLLVMALMAVFVNQLTRSSTLVMLICIIVLVGSYVANLFLPQVGAVLFTSYGQWHNLWIGTTLPFGAMIMKIGMLLGYGMLFFCGGYYIFERKDM